MAKPQQATEKPEAGAATKAPGSPVVPYLKSRVRWRTRAFFIVGVTALVWLALGAPIAIVRLQDVSLPKWIGSAVAIVLSVLVAAIESIPGDQRKAALIFWRLRDPLPGSRAFEKANLSRDARIDIGRLKNVLGGSLPRTPKDQNSTWYGMFKLLEHHPPIQAMHFDYLLFRDWAWLSLVLAAVAGALALTGTVMGFGAPGLLGIAAGVFVALYLLFRQAASERGSRLVNQVLVTAIIDVDAMKRLRRK